MHDGIPELGVVAEWRGIVAKIGVFAEHVVAMLGNDTAKDGIVVTKCGIVTKLGVVTGWRDIVAKCGIVTEHGIVAKRSVVTKRRVVTELDAIAKRGIIAECGGITKRGVVAEAALSPSHHCCCRRRRGDNETTFHGCWIGRSHLRALAQSTRESRL